MNDCIFCKIIKGEIPSYKIYEDEHTYAFLDIAKDCYGHTLVIPKNHAKNLFEINDEDLTRTILATKKIANHYKTLGFSGVNIINACGESAEQSVFHLHFHIIPRKEDDGMHIFPNLEKKDYDLEKIAEILKIKE